MLRESERKKKWIPDKSVNHRLKRASSARRKSLPKKWTERKYIIILKLFWISEGDLYRKREPVWDEKDEEL